MLRCITRALVFGDPMRSQQSSAITIAPNADITETPRFQREAMDTKRLKAIAYLGDKWVLARTRADYIARVQGMV